MSKLPMSPCYFCWRHVKGENVSAQTCSMLWMRLFQAIPAADVLCDRSQQRLLEAPVGTALQRILCVTISAGLHPPPAILPFAWRRGQAQSLLMPIPAPFLMHPWLQEHPVILVPAENVIIPCVSRLPGAANAHGNLCCGAERGAVEQLTSLQTAVRKSIAGCDYVHK